MAKEKSALEIIEELGGEIWNGEEVNPELDEVYEEEKKK